MKRSSLKKLRSSFLRHRDLFITVTALFTGILLTLIGYTIWDIVNNVRVNDRLGNIKDEINFLENSTDTNNHTCSNTTTTFFVVEVPVTSLVTSGQEGYPIFGTPVDIIGNFSGNLLIESATIGEKITLVSGKIPQIRVKWCLQYSNQPSGGSSRRTFVSLFINGTAADGCAVGVPRPSNNWRTTQYAYGYGVIAGMSIETYFSSNVVGPVTLNDGVVFLHGYI